MHSQSKIPHPFSLTLRRLFPYAFTITPSIDDAKISPIRSLKEGFACPLRHTKNGLKLDRKLFLRQENWGSCPSSETERVKGSLSHLAALKWRVSYESFSGFIELLKEIECREKLQCCELLKAIFSFKKLDFLVFLWNWISLKN